MDSGHSPGLPPFGRLSSWSPRNTTFSPSLFGFFSQLRFGKADLSVRMQVRDSRGRRVGRCKEWAKVVGDDQVDARVLAMRHKDLPYVPKLQKATKPERVMTYRSALLTCQLMSPHIHLYPYHFPFALGCIQCHQGKNQEQESMLSPVSSTYGLHVSIDIMRFVFSKQCVLFLSLSAVTLTRGTV